MKLARWLLLLSAVAFAVTAIGYLVVPRVMLSVVGIASSGTEDFLIRTEGVALLAGAVFPWAARLGRSRLIRVVLAGLGLDCVLGSLEDLAAFAQGSSARRRSRARGSASSSASCASSPPRVSGPRTRTGRHPDREVSGRGAVPQAPLNGSAWGGCTGRIGWAIATTGTPGRVRAIPRA